MTSRNPIVVAGMHRSGTSLVSSILAGAGIDMGKRLVPGNAGNPPGYFEDMDFLALNQRLLMAATPEYALGHRDWGWTTEEALDRDRFREGRHVALKLIEGRRGLESRWGWKDPRTTPLLGFWHDLLIESGFDPVYLLLYRFPWDVADSLQRIGFDLFLRHPEYPYAIWSFYNRQLLEFRDRHPNRCLLVNINALWKSPEAFSALLETRWQIETLPSLERRTDADLWHSRSGTDPLISLTAATSPGCTNLLAELDRRADLSAAGLWSAERELRPRLDMDRNVDAAGDWLVDLSVIIPCYNDGEFLLDAIASVERSAPSATELIVVNDGSNEPRTLEILRILRDAGYRILDQRNSGVAAAKNHGISIARGRYILPLHADDRLAEGFVEAAGAVLDADSMIGAVYGDRYEFGLNRGRIHVPNPDEAAREFREHAVPEHPRVATGAMFRKSIWEACGGYDAGLRAGEEWDFWLAAREHDYRFYRLDMVAFERRARPESLSNEDRWPEAAQRRRARIIARHRLAAV